MYVLVMTFKLVLPREPVVAAVLAPRDGACVVFFLGADTVLGLVVTSEVTEVFGDGVAVLLQTCVLPRLAVVPSLMRTEI